MGGGGGMGMANNPPMTMSSLPPMSVSQPLPSNVLSKQQTSLEQQYMQQSSQIFVFSTQWANKAAQAVMQQDYPSIICWHENQSETKKHLAVSQNCLQHFSSLACRNLSNINPTEKLISKGLTVFFYLISL